jgi:hypothetical protein
MRLYGSIEFRTFSLTDRICQLAQFNEIKQFSRKQESLKVCTDLNGQNFRFPKAHPHFFEMRWIIGYPLFDLLAAPKTEKIEYYKLE